MNPSPTQIFLHNPKALRVECRLDDEALDLWWSPKAGESWDCADRNFANRDNPLTVFEQIRLPGCNLGQFVRCDYDAYHVAIHFKEQVLHLALRHDAPVLILWTEKPQRVDFKTARYDEATEQTAQAFAVRHAEPAYSFDFVARLGVGTGHFRHSEVHAKWNSHYAQALLAGGQMLLIGVGLSDADGIAGQVEQLCRQSPQEHLIAVDSALAPIEATGQVVAPERPEWERLRRSVVRGLHSIIDESGAMRASIKNVYYLIWVRDGGFGFPYQAAAGLPLRMAEFCRLLMENPTTVRGKQVPHGRMFGQLINKDYGKYEEDGSFYAIWSAHAFWTQTGDKQFLSGASLDLLEESTAFVETYIFAQTRGLFGSYFADETPSAGCRDYGWDYAIGKPVNPNDKPPMHEGVPITRFYDTYFNLIMHSSYTMLASASEGERAKNWSDKAANLWKKLEPFFAAEHRKDGLPPYGELELQDGRRVMAPHWGTSHSVYIWGLTMPCFAPVNDWDDIRGRLLEEIMKNPRCHFMNGVFSTLASMDTWFHDESRLCEVLDEVARQAMKPGKYLPMAGAMPEKFDAPEGNIYHDIRPQGFAMQSWLAAVASLGLRRLPYGLALRPTQAFTEIKNYSWKGKTLQLRWNKIEANPLLLVNGTPYPGTLQIPENALTQSDNRIELVNGDEKPILLRSTLELQNCEKTSKGHSFVFKGYGLGEIWLNGTRFTVHCDHKGIGFENQIVGEVSVLRFDIREVFTITIE